MDAEKYGIKPDGHIPGLAMHNYMTDFAKHFDIFRRIEFRTKVSQVDKLADASWDGDLRDPKGFAADARSEPASDSSADLLSGLVGKAL